ncbi:CBS domain-containing protein [Dictyobacter arantiisoli]|uniref:CBS domain-containing protein n=1 Tax=Dictyobacter arantiisoli TaxID=2014874 RepID=A0A5A5TJ41_9CHLR|nr:CBS domain-containing protein [Dictyobacter arantiisoli]GCF11631.1 hypothetical protein KDI_51950 [Dictyobacter arantiisoli]
MIVRDIMATKLTTVEPDDTLAHAANLLRQFSVHHLPVARKMYQNSPEGVRTTLLLCEGLLSAQDIDLAVALSEQDHQFLWQDRKVVEVMHAASLRVTPSTSVAAAAQILVEWGLHCLLVVEYMLVKEETETVLVGMLTRSDLLLALARAMGTFEPGMQLDIALRPGDMTPLARTLLLATELHMRINSVLATPLPDGALTVATIRLGTINPTPLLMRLKSEGITYSFGSPFTIRS